MVVRRDRIAYPTIYLCFILLFFWIGAILIGTGYFGNDKAYDIFSFEKPESIKSVILTIATLTVSIFCCYGQFTVMHDASHGAIADNNQFINHLFGWISQFFMGPLSNFYAFKYLHLTHHRFTNDLTVDPDTWASAHGLGGSWLMPLRWLTIDVAYVTNYLPLVIPFYTAKITKNPKAIQRPHPIAEMIIFWIYKFMMIFFIYSMVKRGYSHEILQYWVLPSTMAKSLLAYAFDYLPHSPHRVKLQENPYHTTSYLSTPPKMEYLFSILLFYQNYHIAHHLNPRIPFYKYKQQWIERHVEWLNDKQIYVRRLLKILGEEILPIKK